MWHVVSLRNNNNKLKSYCDCKMLISAYIRKTQLFKIFSIVRIKLFLDFTSDKY